MENKRSLTSEEISAIVDSFDPIDVEEMKSMAELPPGKRWLIGYRKSEATRADLRNKFRQDFPELSLSEINMRVLRALTPVRMGKSYTEPAYYGWLC